MVTMTLAVPEDLRHRMETFSEINWSEVARQAFNKKIEDLEFLKKFKSQSTVTKEDALSLGKELNAKISKKHFEKRGN